MPECVPEPERRDQENEQKEVLPVVVIENSSEEDDDDYNHDLELQGYLCMKYICEINTKFIAMSFQIEYDCNSCKAILHVL